MPIPIGCEQTCTDPQVIALMNNHLQLRKKMRVLEKGSGCGYHAAITSEQIGKQGFLVSVEIIDELKKMAEKNLQTQFNETYEARMKVILGNGTLCASEYGPFDRIYATA